jgi:hypothetical protein
MNIINIKNKENLILTAIDDTHGMLITEIVPHCKEHLALLLEKRLKKLFEKKDIIPVWEILYTSTGEGGIILLFKRSKICLSVVNDPERFAKSKSGNELIQKEIRSAYKDFMRTYQKLSLSDSCLNEDYKRILKHSQNLDLLLDEHRELAVA